MDNNVNHWLHLLARVSDVVLVDDKGYFKWRPTKSGFFTVRSLYLHDIDTHPPFQHRKIWKWKIPLNIKIFPSVSSEGGRFDERQPCKEKLEREPAMCLL
jgi:hypothetical protein